VISFAQSYIFSPRVREVWSDRATLQRWLDVEVALAEAQASVGLIPVSAARRIRECANVKYFDVETLSGAIAFAQHPLTPVLKELVKLCGEPAGGWVHWGATTQNILDTAQSLQLAATSQLIHEELQATLAVLKQRTRAHAGTLQAGRTHGQHAVPITFGFKLACWTLELERHQHRLERLRKSAFVVRMGGAAGTYAAMGGKGREVEARVAVSLGLQRPGIGGRADADHQAEYVSLLGMLAATCEKIAADLIVLQRSEIAEVSEHHYVGRTGSSTMAQKRNPTEAQRVVMLARMARSRVPLALDSMVRQDEGDAVASHIMDYILPESSVFGCSALTAMRELLASMQVHSERMLKNLQASGGLIMAESLMMHLAESIGRDHAHEVVQGVASECVEQGVEFLPTLRRHLEAEGVDASTITAELLDPRHYLGEIPALIEQVVERP
jgi:3-carboxy-cis,cis-muconate cycloisomerase